MPTTYTDQFFTMDPGNAPPANTALTVQKFDYIDFNDNGLIETGAGDTFNGITITSVWRNDTITVIMNGSTVTITGVTFYLATGPAVFTPLDGTVLYDATFLSSTWVNTSTNVPVGSFGPPCFAKGTLIETANGLRAIEDLAEGDLILTRDNGFKSLSWVGHRTVPGTGAWAPIRFARGAIGNNRPLLVSPQHRMLIEGWKAELYFGEDEVLVAAKHLTNGDTICRTPLPEVTYFHLLFDQHEVIFAEGAPSESLHLGDTVLRENPTLRSEIVSLFPELATQRGRQIWKTARPTVKRHEALVLSAA